MTAALVTNSGRSAWFIGVLVLMVYLIFALTLYLLPPGRSKMAVESSAAKNQLTTLMSDDSNKSSKRVLDPYDRVSEVLFGLIMSLPSPARSVSPRRAARKSAPCSSARSAATWLGGH